MYRKDLITAEIERLAQVLARIMGLKLEGDLVKANELFNETIENSFKLSPFILEDSDISAFENWLNETDLPAEKLDSLSEFLYYELGISPQRNALIAPRLNLIYKVLAEKHKIVHLVNFHRQEIIQQYL
ncbi:hypothetical protein [Pedobacter chitinilyticus]|uniref:Uncharacterized protein n=1 Tax=Pedobacter chitinilyticus TaxID=2233776 RepID=A0A443YPQ1_9SPHI|nr:hypothetical protein [Pedobacter chitinilyticus]RWU05754.1 hypothetical protein DPV69_16605 [Pedobacter chitinilyticus]